VYAAGRKVAAPKLARSSRERRRGPMEIEARTPPWAANVQTTQPLAASSE
jgi:hypothetical protein